MSATKKRQTLQVGRVNVHEPTTARSNWRIDYYEGGRRKFASGGRTREEALAAAKRIDDRLQAGSGKQGDKTFGEAVAAYLASNPKSPRTKRPLGKSTLNSRRERLTRATKPLANTLCKDIDRQMLDSVRQAERTDGMELEVTTDLRELLTWGRGCGYFSTAQAEMLPRGIPLANLHRESARPSRRARADGTLRDQGDGEMLVTEEHAPSWDQVKSLASEMQRMESRYGALIVELAASTGLRWGELCALTIDDVNLKNQEITVRRQVISLPRNARFGPPKNRLSRRAVFPTKSPTGYSLKARLNARIKAVAAEHAAGKNPQQLLFPTMHGHVWWHGAFSTDFFASAAKAAGWPRQTWIEEVDGVRVQRNQWVLTWHILRHRFALTAKDDWQLTAVELCKVGGWSSTQVVYERYYRTSEEHQTTARAKIQGLK